MDGRTSSLPPPLRGWAVIATCLSHVSPLWSFSAYCPAGCRDVTGDVWGNSELGYRDVSRLLETPLGVCRCCQLSHFVTILSEYSAPSKLTFCQKSDESHWDVKPLLHFFSPFLLLLLPDLQQSQPPSPPSSLPPSMLVMADVHTSLSSLERIFFHETSRKENCKKCFCRLVLCFKCHD